MLKFYGKSRCFFYRINLCDNKKSPSGKIGTAFLFFKEPDYWLAAFATAIASLT